MNDWDKILDDFARKCKGGAPDMTNPRHLALLRESLIKFGWNENAMNEFLGNLREGKPKTNPWQTKSGNWRGERPDGSRQSYDDIEKTKKWIGGEDFEDEEGDSTQEKEEELSPELQNLDNEQKETSDKRDRGEAGAGGQAASQGESRYCHAVDTLDYDDFRNDPKNKIDDRVKARKANTDSKGRIKLSQGERNDLEAMGFDPVDSDEALEYLETREAWAEQELQRIKDQPETQINPETGEEEPANVYYNSDGFNGKPDAYKDWMRAAFDGALATKKLLKESRMDTDKPHRTMQSTTEVDNTVQTGLQNKLVENLKKAGYTDKEIKAYLAKGKDHKPLPKKDLDENLQRDIDHYKKELKSFKKFRKYHDTYVVGQDKNGNTFIVSISNKKDSGLNDPQNNTTPAQRFALIKEKYGKDVANEVTGAIDRSIERVTTVTKVTNDSASKHKVDDDFVDVAILAGRKYLHGGSNEPGISKRGTKRKRTDYVEKVAKEKAKIERYTPPKNEKEKIWLEKAQERLAEYEPIAEKFPDGKPAPGNEFGCWLDENGISLDKWNAMSDKDKLLATQKYMGDKDYAEKNGTPPYVPYSKMWIKVGEVATGGHRQMVQIRSDSMLKTMEKNNPKAHKSAETALKDLEDRLKPKKPSGAQKEAAIRKVYDEYVKNGGKLDPLHPGQNSSSITEAGKIKSVESQSVNEAHEEVRATIRDKDAEDGFPERDEGGKPTKNGPRTRSYIETVMGAMHFDSYIMMDDDEDDKLIVQMGIRGAKPSHIRGCLAEKSGRADLADKPEELMEHLLNTSELAVRPEGKGINGAIVITNDDGTQTTLMDDSWRTAGTSQKVASGFGDDMKKCVKEKVDADRKKNRIVGN